MVGVDFRKQHGDRTQPNDDAADELRKLIDEHGAVTILLLPGSKTHVYDGLTCGVVYGDSVDDLKDCDTIL